MSIPSEPERTKLFSSIIFTNKEALNEAISHLTGKFGPLDFLSEITSFPGSGYYEPEMGAIEGRRFMSFNKLVHPGELASIKLATNSIEKEISGIYGSINAPESRAVNIDPGLLTPGSLVLATGKEASHRIYLSDGIWADLTLIYENGSYRALQRTYLDYASKEVILMLNMLRKSFMKSKSLASCAGIEGECR